MGKSTRCIDYLAYALDMLFHINNSFINFFARGIYICENLQDSNMCYRLLTYS